MQGKPAVSPVNELSCQRTELPTSQVQQHLQARNPHTFGTAEDEVASRRKSPAAINVAAPPATTRRQGDTFHSAIHSNGQQGEKLRSNHGKFDTNRLKRKLGNSNYGELERQASPSATKGRQKDSVQQEHPQTPCGSIESRHRYQPIQKPQKELQNPNLEKFQADTYDPTTAGRPGVFEGFGSGIGDEEPNMQKIQAKMSSKVHQTFRLKASRRSPMFNQQFSSQLERFLATLTMADHRLFGATAGYRIQVADCTLADAGASLMEGWTTEIYTRLSVILSGYDRWETRLSDLEAFVGEHGRLPRRQGKSHYERSLNFWLNSQCAAFRQRRLVLHRLQKLLSASSPLIRRRAEGWQTGDTDGFFMERCNELSEYVQLHHSLPDSPKSQKLAKWWANLRIGSIRLDAGKMKLLQEVHPLVKAESQKWQDAPRLQRSKWEQRFGQPYGFVGATGRLPKSCGQKELERSCYTWLRTQCRKLLAGCLPEDMAQRLRNAHPLIAAKVDTST